MINMMTILGRVDYVKEKDAGNSSAACSNDNLPFLDEGQRRKSKTKN